MASDNGREDTGSKDRATVALVDAKVDGIRALVGAQAEHISDIKADVRAIGAVVNDVIKQGVQLDDHERRIASLEDDKKGDLDWRRVKLPGLVFSGAVAIVAIVEYITQIH